MPWFIGLDVLRRAMLSVRGGALDCMAGRAGGTGDIACFDGHRCVPFFLFGCSPILLGVIGKVLPTRSRRSRLHSRLE